MVDIPSQPHKKPPNRVHVTWAGGQRYDAGRPGGATLQIDGSGETGPGPIDTVLSALAACAAMDVVDILAKRRTPIERYAIDVTGERADTAPRRLRRVRMHFMIDGAGIERGHAERAVDLSMTRYCSVRSSLDPEVPVTFTVSVNGETGAEVRAGQLTEVTEATPTAPMGS